MADVLAEVTAIISKHSLHGVHELTPETRLEEINVQSLDLFEIIFDIEDRFKIVVPEGAKSGAGLDFSTIGQIAEGVSSILAKSKAA